MYDEINSVGGNVGLQGAIHPRVGLQQRAAEEIRSIMVEEGVADMPLGVDVAETCVFFALQRCGIEVRDGQQVMADARKIKSPEEITLLTLACAMVDDWRAVEAGDLQGAATGRGLVGAAVRQGHCACSEGLRPGFPPSSSAAAAATWLLAAGPQQRQCSRDA